MDTKAIVARLTGDILDSVPDDNDMQNLLSIAAARLQELELDKKNLIQEALRMKNG